MPKVLFVATPEEIIHLSVLTNKIQALDLASILLAHMTAIAEATTERDNFVIKLTQKHNQEVTALVVDGLRINKLTGEVEVIELNR